MGNEIKPITIRTARCRDSHCQHLNTVEITIGKPKHSFKIIRNGLQYVTIRGECEKCGLVHKYTVSKTSYGIIRDGYNPWKVI
jgi:hypothetical protein